MRLTLIALTLMTIVPLTSAHANTITAKVDGMVCAFCAKGIETKLKKDENVDQVTISLEDASVVVTAKKERTISVDTVKKAVDYMGFTVKDIQETP